MIKRREFHHAARRRGGGVRIRKYAVGIGRSRAGHHPGRMAARVVASLLQATRTVPIVFVNVTDPVGGGLVDSLARPGGNATGFIDVRIWHRAGNGWSCSKRSRPA